MKKFITTLGVVLALVGAMAVTTLPGCAYFSGQRQLVNTMPQVDFDNLKSGVESTAQLLMDQVKVDLTSQQKAYAATAFKLIREKDNSQRSLFLAQFFDDPAHRVLGQLAIQGVLEFIEGVTGERLELQSLGLSDREVELVDAILDGFTKSLNT